jgi:hypothetical protein
VSECLEEGEGRSQGTLGEGRNRKITSYSNFASQTGLIMDQYRMLFIIGKRDVQCEDDVVIGIVVVL